MMKSKQTTLELQEFFPVALEIYDIVSDENQITIYMKSKSKECTCPTCGTISKKHHGTYHRRVQDLPIFGESVWLDINAYKFRCENPSCSKVSNVETSQGFLQYKKRMTNRCAFFICALALETSCEATADICKAIGIQVSGDTVIRMLLSRAEECPAEVIDDFVGVDDFACKKGRTYCTVLVNGEKHRIIDILEGRDADTLKVWLKENQHVHRFTRDRASSYAKAIAEVLPDAMQIADRFHLHQNLLDCIKSILNSELPARIKIPKESAELESQTSLQQNPVSKKIRNHANQENPSVIDKWFINPFVICWIRIIAIDKLLRH